MPLPTTSTDGYPCCHAIPADSDGCYCGARQAWPRQLELFTWAELHPDIVK